MPAQPISRIPPAIRIALAQYHSMVVGDEHGTCGRRQQNPKTIFRIFCIRSTFPPPARRLSLIQSAEEPAFAQTINRPADEPRFPSSRCAMRRRQDVGRNHAPDRDPAVPCAFPAAADLPAHRPAGRSISGVFAPRDAPVRGFDDQPLGC